MDPTGATTIAIASTPLTLDQFLALPEEEPSLEYAEGVVTQKLSPKGQHSALQAELLVDPADESVLVFRPSREASALHGTDRIDLSDILPDFELTVEQLFASLL